MEIIACIFIVCVGTLGHFLFEWCGHRHWAGILFAVNESTWEHIKLTIYPSILWLIAEWAWRGSLCEVLFPSFAALLTTMVLIPVLFYGYTAITHRNWLITDILCFIASVELGRLVFGTLLQEAWTGSTAAVICAAAGFAAILAAYFTLSYHAPHCFLFRDPVTGSFGVTGHGCHSHFHTI